MFRLFGLGDQLIDGFAGKELCCCQNDAPRSAGIDASGLKQKPAAAGKCDTRGASTDKLPGTAAEFAVSPGGTLLGSTGLLAAQRAEPRRHPLFGAEHTFQQGRKIDVSIEFRKIESETGWADPDGA